jgi:hypothetical protein
VFQRLTLSQMKGSALTTGSQAERTENLLAHRCETRDDFDATEEPLHR